MKALVLLSGGLDSTITLFWAIRHFTSSAVAFSYGQPAAEIEAAVCIAEMASVRLRVHELPTMKVCSPLVRPYTNTIPGRNLVLLSVAAHFAALEQCNVLLIGINKGDQDHYRDCSNEFLGWARNALGLHLLFPKSEEVSDPFPCLSKAGLVSLASRLGADCWRAVERSVSCHRGDGCGECLACFSRATAFEFAGVKDPAIVSGG